MSLLTADHAPDRTHTVDWDDACRKVPRGWFMLTAALVSGGLWAGLVGLVVSAC